MGKLKNYKNLGLSFLSGFMLVLSDAGIGLFPFAWIAIVPLLIAIFDAKSWKSAFVYGFISGLIHFLGTIYWIAKLFPFTNLPSQIASVCVTTIAYFALSAYLSIYPAIFSAIIFIFRLSKWRLIFFSATLWIGLEWIMSWMITGFPWGSLGYTQWNNLPIIQISEIFGVLGVSFLIVIFNVTLFEVIRLDDLREKMIISLPTIVIIFVSLIFGFFVLNSEVIGEKAKVAIIPGNVRQIDKWQQKNFQKIFLEYVEKIQNASRIETEINFVSLPETAIPGAIFSGDENNYRKLLFQILEKDQIHLLTGAPHYAEDRKVYNSVFLVDPRGKEIGSYSKMHLVPFGEYTPLANFLPSFVQMTGFEKGKDQEIFDIPKSENGKMGIAICFESSFPNFVRKFVKKGANVLGILTNDAWFENTPAPIQHFSMARFRAIENRVSVFRCANGGFSCTIDKIGRITSAKIPPSDRESILFSEITIGSDQNTFYTKYGDWFPIFCFVASVLFCGAWFFRDRTENFGG